MATERTNQNRMDTESLLVRRAKQGDTEAFTELYRQVYKDLYRLALFMLQNEADAEDMVSETVLDAWSQIRNLRAEEAFRAWICKILSNKCRKKRREYIDKYEELPETLPDDSPQLDEQTAVRQAFSKLEEDDKTILSLHLFGGYSSKEIGAYLNMPDNTVRSRHKRALQKLKTYLTGS